MSEREFSILQHPKCPVHWLNIVFNNYIIQEHIIICVYRHKLTLLQMNSILQPFCHVVISTGVLHIAMQRIWQSGQRCIFIMRPQDYSAWSLNLTEGNLVQGWYVDKVTYAGMGKCTGNSKVNKHEGGITYFEGAGGMLPRWFWAWEVAWFWICTTKYHNHWNFLLEKYLGVLIVGLHSKTIIIIMSFTAKIDSEKHI